MKRLLTIALLTGVLGPLGAACTATATDKYPTYDAMCEDVAAQECQVALLCNTTVETCKVPRKKLCLDAASTAIQGGRKYTPTRADDCVNKTKDTYSAKVVTPAMLAALSDTCQRVYAGTSDKGAACKVDYDCSGSNICDKGFCGQKTEKKKGEGCANPGEICETGTFCLTQAQGAVRICTSKKAKGDPCDPTNSPCLEDLRCNNAVCMDRVGNGGQCGGNEDCSSAAPYCDTALPNKICTLGLSFASGAADCKAFGAGT